ncbi:ABC transporter ATP-binding protein [Ruficoccus amylovorans]|uniref:ABC transporter ATP-binding protein n=1 Tax=Ruficoccus amylovorans TaxID=1804625 RepID=A0A842HIH4_9BACT|nr:ABC transporter ATP-binding protein [Ruficoccus amylovorans]MBC2596313.1 ABC transporter ATP-binding protein [Ruficoccus amylovorans]
MEPEQPAIEVLDLTKSYGPRKAIDRISFEVAPGQVVGFLGPNGAGKSTTMRILCGIMPATSGIVRVCGIPVASQSGEVKKHIGYMPESNPLPEDMRVIEYLRYRARLKEIPARRIRDRVEEAMEVCELHRKPRRRLIGTLSKGFRQRVGIADAILAEPEVIVMDEPTIGLDPHQILSIRNLIDSLRGRMTVIISSHILPEIELCCDRVIIINQGRVVANGTSQSLRERFLPMTRYRVRTTLRAEGMATLLPAVSPELALESSAQTEGMCEYLMEAPSHLDLTEAFIDALRARQARIHEVARLQPNLEDIFMSATKRSWDESLPEDKADDTRENETDKTPAQT